MRPTCSGDTAVAFALAGLPGEVVAQPGQGVVPPKGHTLVSHARWLSSPPHAMPPAALQPPACVLARHSHECHPILSQSTVPSRPCMPSISTASWAPPPPPPPPPPRAHAGPGGSALYPRSPPADDRACQHHPQRRRQQRTAGAVDGLRPGAHMAACTSCAGACRNTLTQAAAVPTLLLWASAQHGDSLCSLGVASTPPPAECSCAPTSGSRCRSRPLRLGAA
jgi:hypothetical protein